MPHSKDNGKMEQAAFVFDAVVEAPKVVVRIDAANCSIAAPQMISAPVVMLVDRRRSRHLEVVRKLLAETGVFRTD